MRLRNELVDALWRRHQSPWNWLIQALGASLLLLAVWTRSSTEAGAGIGLVLAGALPLRMPTFPETGRLPRLARRAIRAEVVWVNRPWDRRKRIAALLLFVGAVLVLAALRGRSLPGLGLTLGFLVLLRVRAANRDAGIKP